MQPNLAQTLPQLPLYKLSFLFSPPVFFLILLIFFILYCIGTGTLWYHWSKYGMGRSEIAIVKVLFLFVSVALFVFALLAISYL
jgi:hypothetical protein